MTKSQAVAIVALCHAALGLLSLAFKPYTPSRLFWLAGLFAGLAALFRARERPREDSLAPPPPSVTLYACRDGRLGWVMSDIRIDVQVVGPDHPALPSPDLPVGTYLNGKSIFDTKEET